MIDKDILLGLDQPFVPAEEPRADREERTWYRAIWLSDMHLGVRDCKAEFLYEFLRHTDSEYLYLVGDIVDLWKLKTGWYWPEINNKILRLILKKAKKGTRVIYIPGNHDETLRDWLGTNFGDVELRDRTVHETALGKRYLVFHGDEFDSIVKHNKWLALVGSEAYDWLLWVNGWLNYVRRKMGFSYWSLSRYIKGKVKNAVSYISNYEHVVCHAAQSAHTDGVVCGHIHTAAMCEMNGMHYCNTGDWVESCTALAEHEDGRLELIYWTDQRQDFIEYQKPAVHEDRHRDRRVAPAS